MYWGLITIVIVVALLLLVAAAMKPRDRHESRIRVGYDLPDRDPRSSQPREAVHH